MELNMIIFNSETYKLLLSVNLLDVPLPYAMASQGNHGAGACYQLPVLDEKRSCWVFWHEGRHRNLKSWGTLSASCTAHAVCQCWVTVWVCLDLWVHLLGTSFFEGFCFLPYSTKEKDFVSGKQLLTFVWHLSKTQTFVKFHTLSKAFHFQQLKCGKIPHFLQSVPKPSQLLSRTRLWEHKASHVCVCLWRTFDDHLHGAASQTPGWEPTPQSWGTSGESFLQLSFQTNLGQMEIESKFPAPPQRTCRQHGTYSGTHQAGWRGWWRLPAGGV